MKKIHLTDGMPTTVRQSELSEDTKLLLDDIVKKCSDSGLSYKEINKALHVADEELYRKVLEKPIKN